MSLCAEPVCGRCLYFRAVDAVSGTCHRFPPVFAGEASPRETHHWRFPSVGAHGWCGEFLAEQSAQMSSSGGTI